MDFLTKRPAPSNLRRLRGFLLLIVFLASIFPAQAHTEATSTIPVSEEEVPEIAALLTFYSHSFGENFPHAFVVIETEEAEPDAFGFSARSLSPGILLGSVRGEMKVPGARYIRQSNPQFSLTLDAEQLASIRSVREIWEEPTKPRYHLEKRNCVHLVGELAESVGLETNQKSKYFKSPGKYLREVAALNPRRVELLHDNK